MNNTQSNQTNNTPISDAAMVDSNGHPLNAEDAKLGFAAFVPIDVARLLELDLIQAKQQLKEAGPRLAWLNVLEACGIDNWDGYSVAQEMMGDE